MTPDPITRSTFAELCGAVTDATAPAGRPGFSYVQTHELMATIPLLAQRGPCVLVTHASDTTATPEMLEAIIAKAPNVRHWFAVNCGIGPEVRGQRSEVRGQKSEVRRQKTEDSRIGVTALPIGLKSNHPTDEAIQPLRAAAERPEVRDQGSEVRELVYCCLNWRFLAEGPAGERKALHELAGRWPWATVQASVPPAAFYRGIRGHAYTLCPRGAGPDTHRAWESLHLGSIPICRRCPRHPAMEHFGDDGEDLPVLFVHAWEQITEAMLLENLPRLRAKLEGRQEKLAAGYWRERIEREAAKARGEE